MSRGFQDIYLAAAYYRVMVPIIMRWMPDKM
jgi:hypothetical protein